MSRRRQVEEMLWDRVGYIIILNLKNGIKQIGIEVSITNANANAIPSFKRVDN